MKKECNRENKIKVKITLICNQCLFFNSKVSKCRRYSSNESSKMYSNFYLSTYRKSSSMHKFDSFLSVRRVGQLEITWQKRHGNLTKT